LEKRKKETVTRIKTSCGIWCLKAGYEDLAIDQLTTLALEKLDWLVDGFEYHYPFEIDETTYKSVLRSLGKDKDVYGVGLGTFANPIFAKGAFINPDPKRRKENLEITKRAIDLAGELKARLIIWPGREGYSYLFESDYAELWTFLIDGIAEIVDYANQQDVSVLLEPSDSKPPMTLLMRNIGMTIFLIKKVGSRGVDTSHLKVNVDWQHSIMSGENLAEYAILLAQEGLLGHLHANAGWGKYGDFHIAGSSFFMQTLELAASLQDIQYGKKGERIGFDIVPFNEDAFAAMKRSILQWEFIYDLAGQVDRQQLKLSHKQRDASMSQETVYAALGLDKAFLEKLQARYG